MEVRSGPNWDDDLGGSPVYAKNDPNLEALTPEQRKAVEGNIRHYIDWFQKNPGPCARPGLPRTGWPQTSRGSNNL